MLDALALYQALTGYPLALLIAQTGAFLRDQGPALRRAYEQRTTPADPPQLVRLRQLRQALRTTCARLPALSAQLPQLGGWELLEALEELSRALTSLENLPLYLRLPSPDAAPTYVLGQNQTLELVAQRAGSADPGQDWSRLALAQDLAEDEYGPGTAVGLEPLRTSVRSAGRLLAVLGPQDGELALGKDLQAKLAFDAQAQDLVSLSPTDTADQTLAILLTTRRGAIPYRPELGPLYELLVGASQNLLGLPTVLRQLGELLGTDDTIASFQLVQTRTEQDGLYLDLQVQFAAGPPRSYALKSA